MKERRGVKTRWLLILALCLLCWTSASNYNAEKCHDKVIYALFKNKFKEPIEIIYFMMDDARIFKVTSYLENRVSFSVRNLKSEFRTKGYEVSNIILIIHNHTKRAYFSTSDIIMYRLFKGMGFDGKFYLYVYRTRKIYELAERLR